MELVVAAGALVGSRDARKAASSYQEFPEVLAYQGRREGRSWGCRTWARASCSAVGASLGEGG